MITCVSVCVASFARSSDVTSGTSWIINLSLVLLQQENNLKIIIIENGGYLSIKQTQERYFSGNFIACGPDSGLGLPELAKISNAYGISCSHTETLSKTKEAFEKYLNKKGPYIFVVSVDRTQQFEPKPSSKKLKDGSMVSLPLDDMYPFISKRELEKIRSIIQ